MATSDPENIHETSSARLDAPPSHRTAALFGALFWAFIFSWLWLGATPLARVLGPLWAAIGIASPVAYVFSLALSIPWFGGGPGITGAHLPYLIDMGLMGFVGGHLARRAVGRLATRPHGLDPWITLFAGCTWVGLMPQWRWLLCELQSEKLGFMAAIYTQAANAGTYGLRVALDLTLGAGFYVALRDRPWPPGRQIVLLKTLLAALAFTAVVGFLQYAKLISLGWWRADIAYSARFGYPRLQSLFWDAGWMAEYLAPLAPAALAFALAARGGRSRTAWIALAVFLGLAQLLTMQRAGWLALAAAYATVAFAASVDSASRRAWSRPLMRAALAILAAVVLGGALALIVPDLRRRAAELFIAKHRTGIWIRALLLIRTAPLAGIGTGNYAHEFYLFHRADVEGLEWMTAHNQYLHIWAERGLIGLILFIVIVGRVGSGIWNSIRNSSSNDAVIGRIDPQSSRIVSAVLLGGLVAYLVDGLFQYNFYVYSIEILFWLLVGWHTWITPRRAAPPRRWPRGVVPTAIILMACAVIWENAFVLRPWQAWLPDQWYQAAGASTRLPIPAQAHGVHLKLASFDPNLKQYPITYTVKLDGTTVASEVFNDTRQWPLHISFPASRAAGAQLEISVSRTWSPWMYGMRLDCPVMDLGVMFAVPIEWE